MGNELEILQLTAIVGWEDCYPRSDIKRCSYTKARGRGPLLHNRT